MNKRQFLAALRTELDGLPQNDINRSLDYYSEMIDDRIEDGLTEEEAVEAMGAMDDIASQIFADVGTSRQETPKGWFDRSRFSRTWKAWEIILLALGSPVWVPLLLAAGVVALSLVIIVGALYLVAWSVLLSFYAADLGFAAGAVGGVFSFWVLLCTGRPIHAALSLGAGLVCAGLAVLLFFAVNWLALYTVKAAPITVQWVKSWFVRKERAV